MAAKRQKTTSEEHRAHPAAEASHTDHHVESGDASQQKEKKADYVTAQQLAEVLQISEGTVHRLRRTGRIPAVMLTDRLIRFNLRDVQRALRPHRRPEEDTDHLPEETGPSPQLSFDDFDSKFESD